MNLREHCMHLEPAYVAATGAFASVGRAVGPSPWIPLERGPRSATIALLPWLVGFASSRASVACKSWRANRGLYDLSKASDTTPAQHGNSKHAIPSMHNAVRAIGIMPSGASGKHVACLAYQITPVRDERIRYQSASEHGLACASSAVYVQSSYAHLLMESCRIS